MSPSGPSDSTPPTLLTPENCRSSTRIRAFLRLSRMATDDTIRQHLNEIKSNTGCDEYFNSKIAPQWETRSKAIQYCDSYSKTLRKRTEEGIALHDREASLDSIEKLEKKEPEEFNLRLDPYALRNHNQKLEEQYSQCDAIDSWVKNEKNVEDIIREQTNDILNDKCYYKDWLEGFKKLSS
ncbi:caffeine-induced death protein 2 [Scheffersomyces xylosifermentans]|uniref:caffeine-induced death protein 2 n=1 Tax=Scheffersomyces xylosifermentans TaxID=1304137 RepID=UPI00315C83E8